MLVSLMLASLVAPAHVLAAQVAQPLFLPLVDQPGAGVEAPLQVLAGLSVASSIELVSALPPGSFQSFDPTRLYRLGPDTALWLRLATIDPFLAWSLLLATWAASLAAGAALQRFIGVPLSRSRWVATRRVTVP